MYDYSVLLKNNPDYFPSWEQYYDLSLTYPQNLEHLFRKTVPLPYFEDIAYEVNGRDTKVIFVGDPAQLPPVGEKYPIVTKFPMGEATLDEVVRYDGSIAEVAEHIRSESLFNTIVYPFSTTSDGTVTCMRREEWLEKAIAFFKSESYQDNPDHVRFLVWRNKTAAVLNNHVRTQLWGKDAPDYVPGDLEEICLRQRGLLPRCPYFVLILIRQVKRTNGR